LLRFTGPLGSGGGHVVEYGGRLAFEVAAVTLALEGLGRAVVDASVITRGPNQTTTTVVITGSSRFTGSAEVALGNGSSFVIGFGRDFAPPGETLSRLQAVAALRVGLGRVPGMGL